MLKKQKKKRKKEYIPKQTPTRGVKPPIAVEVTTRNMLEKGLITDYIKWADKPDLKVSKASFDVFTKWKKFAYELKSERQKCSKIFLEWYKKQISKNLKVYAFDRDRFTEYRIKEAFELQITDNLKNLFTEITPISKNKREPGSLNCTFFDRNSKNQMDVY